MSPTLPQQHGAFSMMNPGMNPNQLQMNEMMNNMSLQAHPNHQPDQSMYQQR